LHAPPAPIGPTEGDGISYRGIVWFVVILTVTTLVCQGLVLLFLKYEIGRAARNDAPMAPLSLPAHQLPPPPNLLTDEPANLRQFRAHEDATLSGYGWVDRNAGTVRIPIDRAKELVLERGFGAAPPAPAAAVKKDE
jgi:hypothetical protein